jgi:hypothetical protein
MEPELQGTRYHTSAQSAIMANRVGGVGKVPLQTRGWVLAEHGPRSMGRNIESLGFGGSWAGLYQFGIPSQLGLSRSFGSARGLGSFWLGGDLSGGLLELSQTGPVGRQLPRLTVSEVVSPEGSIGLGALRRVLTYGGLGGLVSGSPVLDFSGVVAFLSRKDSGKSVNLNEWVSPEGVCGPACLRWVVAQLHIKFPMYSTLPLSGPLGWGEYIGHSGVPTPESLRALVSYYVIGGWGLGEPVELGGWNHFTHLFGFPVLTLVGEAVSRLNLPQPSEDMLRFVSFEGLITPYAVRTLGTAMGLGPKFAELGLSSDVFHVWAGSVRGG